MDLLRIHGTAGSVDDGKFNLIGRALHDSKAVYEDRLASVKRGRINRSNGTDRFVFLRRTGPSCGEREQGSPSMWSVPHFRGIPGTKYSFSRTTPGGTGQYTPPPPPEIWPPAGVHRGDLAVISWGSAPKGIFHKNAAPCDSSLRCWA